MDEIFFEKLMTLLMELSGSSAKTWEAYQELLKTIEGDDVAKKKGSKKPKGK